jgi:DNA processing protein
VFAIPGRVDSDSSSGTNALIRDQHAKLVTNVDDILDELGEAGELLRGQAKTEDGTSTEPLPARLNLSADEQAVHAVLSRQEQTIELIAEAAGKPPFKVASTLITLQLKGLVRQLPGGQFVKTSNTGK